MRTKIPILLYCANEDLLGSLSLALELRRYDVLPTREPKAAVRLAAGRSAALACGVLVHAQRGDFAGRLIHLLLESGSRMPLLLVDRAGDLAPVRYADMVLYGRNTQAAHILAALDALRLRKRGTLRTPISDSKPGCPA